MLQGYTIVELLSQSTGLLRMLVFIDKTYFLLRKKMLYPTSSRSASSDRSVRRFRDYDVRGLIKDCACAGAGGGGGRV